MSNSNPTCKTICEKSIYYYPSNNLSSKQLQSKMIQSRRSFTYNHSRMSTIYNTLLGLDYDQNRELLFLYKYKLYTRYLNDIHGQVTQDKRLALYAMYQQLLSSLSPEEYNFVFEIVVPIPVLPPVVIESGITFYVVLRKMPKGTQYFIFKNLTRDFLFLPLHRYTFDLSDPSNLGSRLSFSEEDESNLPYRGIEYRGVPGNIGSSMVLNLYALIRILYTFDQELIHQSYACGYSTPSIQVHENDYPIQRRAEIEGHRIRQYSNIAVYEDRGPRFSINDSIHPIILRESNHFYYEVTYGTYYLNIPKIYACTLLNKGYEEYVTFVGDISILDSVYGTFLEPGLKQEGEYSFYYGKVAMTVKKPFPVSLSLYCRSFGYMGGLGIIRFVEPYTPTERSDVVSLPVVNVLRSQGILRFNQTTSNVLYGLSMGVYYVFIETVHVAFLNRQREHLFSVTGIGIDGVAPDGMPCTFYIGDVRILVLGNFDKLSMCTQSGYSGGYKQLVYNAFYGSHTYPTLTNIFNSNKRLYAQNTLNVLKDGFSFNQYDTLENFTLLKGTYRIFHSQSKYPITILNHEKESLIYIETLQPEFTVVKLAPNGLSYTFYYGVFDLVVKGNFVTMPIYAYETPNNIGITTNLFTYANK